MSFVRWGTAGSAVYVFESDRGLECCSCPLTPDQSFTTVEVPVFLAHLAEHRAAGDTVPAWLEGDLADAYPSGRVL